MSKIWVYDNFKARSFTILTIIAAIVVGCLTFIFLQTFVPVSLVKIAIAKPDEWGILLIPKGLEYPFYFLWIALEIFILCILLKVAMEKGNFLKRLFDRYVVVNRYTQLLVLVYFQLFSIGLLVGLYLSGIPLWYYLLPIYTALTVLFIGGYIRAYKFRVEEKPEDLE